MITVKHRDVYDGEIETGKNRAAIMLFKGGLCPFVERELQSHYGDDWKKQAAESLRFDPGNDWDTWAYLAVMWEHWNLIFRNTLGPAERSIVQELRGVRNKWAHEKTFSSDDTYRAMDSMERLLEAVSAGDVALTINQQKMEVMRLKLAEQTRHDAKRRASGSTEGNPAAGLSPWRDIIEPHKDVASGTIKRPSSRLTCIRSTRTGATAEYGDPVEFFRRTYLTQGLSDLLTNSLKRIVQNQGDPVVACKRTLVAAKRTRSWPFIICSVVYRPVNFQNVDELISSWASTRSPQSSDRCSSGNTCRPVKSTR